MNKIVIWPVFVLIICCATGITRAERIIITGSTTVQPIAEKTSKSYQIIHPEVKIEVTGGGSGNGIKAIIDGTTDIGNASRFIRKKELRYAHGKGVYPVPFQIGYDCIVPIVHPDNKIENLNIVQLRKIYAGSIHNWSSIGGGDAPIKVVSRDTSSGTYEVWGKKVMGEQTVLPGAKLEHSNGDVVNAIASDRNAIGYIGLGYLKSNVKPVRVNDIAGSQSTTLDGTYPLTRSLFMFTRGWPTREALKFINFVLNPDSGQKIVARCGFVALYGSAPHPGNDLKERTSDQNYISETRANIHMVQECLGTLGYSVGPADGIKGTQTITAIVAFQKQNNLPLELRISKKMTATLSEQFIQTLQIN